MVIYTHPYYCPEIQYVLYVLFDEFLGFSYSVQTGDYSEVTVCLENGNRLIIEDHFFFELKAVHYLQQEHIPMDVVYGSMSFIPESDIPAIFGYPGCKIFNEGEQKTVRCQLDVIASAFFMLTRWEEYVNPSRDQHDRFPAFESLAYRFGFLDRPVVNEYVEMLWNMLSFLGIQQNRRERTFRFVPTHDVDMLQDQGNILRRMAGNLIRNRSIKLCIQELCDRKRKPFDVFDHLMNLSEQAGVKSRFYFMSADDSGYDYEYYLDDPLFVLAIEKIKKRGHVIGFHPGYHTYIYSSRWKEEKQCLEKASHAEVDEGRQHFLRFRVPDTWRIWNENGMRTDSSLSYPEQAGFRCGVCYPYPVFDILRRTMLALRERPLIAMDGTFVYYQRLNPQHTYEHMMKLMNKVHQYQGDFVFLWHNSGFNAGVWRLYEGVVKSLYEQAAHLY